MDLSKVSLEEALQLVEHVQKIGAISSALSGGCSTIKPSASNGTTPWVVGKQYFIRTVTMYFSGRLTNLYDQYVTLESAAWLPDTGRFADFLAGKEANEVEPYPLPVNISIGAIVDFCEYSHTLPSKQK